jgi:hypothetical protein
MPDWVVLILGVLILALIFADRHRVRDAWRNPSRWYAVWNFDETWDSRAPSQPLSVVLGIVLGVAAIVYGVVGILT